ncbi:MAG: DUF3667 domain-containing protein [Bacteroidetes bacterium]|nr:DUF3667 domain-containing protein [Bacteroidota bacterium]
MKKHYRKENDCLNCGTTLQGHFCHNCGQENLQIKESFGHMMSHAISDYFHFDHQFFGTLKPLLFRPGFLTNEYMAGRRVRYLHPVKMYIFISVVYFLVAFQSKNADRSIKISYKPSPARIVNGQRIPNDTTYAQYLETQKKLPPAQRDGFIGNYVSRKSYEYREKYGPRAAEVFVGEVEHNIPKMMFVLLPIFAWLLQIAFRKNHKFYVEHLIYAFHFHCFWFLFSAIVISLELLMPGDWKQAINGLMTVQLIIGAVYLYKSLRAVYHRSGFRTITKMIGITVSYSLIIGVCMILVTVITAALP